VESVHVLSVSSLKGGVGKTTVTLGLASAAFARGVRTLVVDLDPQSDVSTGMDIQVAGRLNIADVLANPKEKVVRQAITSSGWAKVHPGTIDVLIGSPSAINFDGPHPSVRDVWKLEEALAAVEADYDLVLVDCAPSLNALTRTAWAASDRVMVVTEPGLFSVAAADRALRAIEEIRRGLSPRLQPLGIVVNRVRPARARSSAPGAHLAAAGSGGREAAAHLARRLGTGTRLRLRPAARPHHPHRAHRRPGARRPELISVSCTAKRPPSSEGGRFAVAPDRRRGRLLSG
jgi:chromosome partitioning protein